MTEDPLRALVADVRQALVADVALAFRLVMLSDGVLRAVGLVLDGDPMLEGAMARFEGIPSARWHMDLGTLPPIGRYQARARDAIADDVRAEAWTAFGFTSQLGCLAPVDGHLWGWIGALRRGLPVFTAADETNPRLPASALLARLGALVRAERGVSEVARAVMRGTDVLFAEPGAARALDVGDRRALLADQLGAPSPGTVRHGWAAGAPFEATGLSQPGGEPAWLVTLYPVWRFRLTSLLSLSPAQRRVAELAAEGATVEEMARALQRSVGTIKTHLRRVYEVTGVASRAELLELLRDTLPH